MLGKFWRGIALVVFWVLCAFVYQSLLHTDDYQKSVASTIESKPMKSAKRKSKRKRKKPYLLEIRVRDADTDVDVHQMEQQLNQMSVDLIDLKISQGIPNGH